MSYQYVTIKSDNKLHEFLIAELQEIGFDSFEEKNMELLAYIQKELFNDEKLNERLNAVDEGLSYTVNDLPDVNWNQEWEAQFEPLEIANQVYIRASFHPEQNTFPYQIIINPKMSFGTGHHETTSMMIEQMLTLNIKGRRVLDVGSGTGILSVMASKLGASFCFGVDHEVWAYQNAIENAGENNCINCHFIHGTINDVSEGEFDFVLANINKNVIISELEQYEKKLVNNGQLLLSGFLEENVYQVEQLANAYKLRLNKANFKNDWAFLSFVKGD